MGAYTLEATHEEFMRLVHAVESNKKNLQSNRNMPGFSPDDEQNIRELIRWQERLLKDLMAALKPERTDTPRA